MQISTGLPRPALRTLEAPEVAIPVILMYARRTGAEILAGRL